jgi:DNA-binding NtrC family response regulator
MTDEKILLVDDEEEFTRVLSERMKNRGLKVDTALSGPEALEKAEGESYDAVILDLLMPGMDGIETLERLLKKRPELQVIILTGHATVKTGIDAVKMGAMDFIEKPADIKELMEKIKEAKTKKMVLVEKRMEAKIKELIKSKGW